MFFAQAVLMVATQKAKQGEQVVLNLKFGKLRLSRGEIKFDSERLSRTPNASALSLHNKNDDRSEVSPSMSRF